VSLSTWSASTARYRRHTLCSRPIELLHNWHKTPSLFVHARRHSSLACKLAVFHCFRIGNPRWEATKKKKRRLIQPMHGRGVLVEVDNVANPIHVAAHPPGRKRRDSHNTTRLPGWHTGPRLPCLSFPVARSCPRRSDRSSAPVRYGRDAALVGRLPAAPFTAAAVGFTRLRSIEARARDVRPEPPPGVGRCCRVRIFPDRATCNAWGRKKRKAGAGLPSTTWAWPVTSMVRAPMTLHSTQCRDVAHHRHPTKA
jgi:hypothetical protein